MVDTSNIFEPMEGGRLQPSRYYGWLRPTLLINNYKYGSTMKLKFECLSIFDDRDFLTHFLSAEFLFFEKF